MERILNRLRWRNLPLRAKTAAVFVLQILLFVAFAATAYSALDNVRIAIENTLTNVVASRTLAKDIEIKVEELATFQTDIAIAYLNPNFDPSSSETAPLYGNRVNDIESIVRTLQELRVDLRGPVPDSAAMGAFAEFSQNLDRTQDSFNDTFAIVEQLTDKQLGALLLYDQRGAEFEVTAQLTASLPLSLRMATVRSLASSFRTSHTVADQRALLDAINDYTVNYGAEGLPEDRVAETMRLADAYRQQIGATGDLLRRLDRANAAAESQVTQLRGSGTRLSRLIEAQTSSPLDTVALILSQARITLIIGLLLALAGGLVITVVFSRSLGKSMDVLITAARQLEQGNLKTRAAVLGTDEFSVLGASFNAMSVQIEGLIGGLEQRVAERTRDLSITAEIGRAVVALRDPRELMNEIVELIRQRFGYYHAQIFLVDDRRERAELVASTGTAGRELLSRGHFLEVGSRSVIGQVTGLGEPVIAVDTDSGGVHHRNELLPDTRSEMALPMRIGDRIIGALDVQSVAPNAFAEDVVVVFQTMADELAIALENARILNDLHEAQENLVSLERRLTADAWRTYHEGRSADAPAAFQYADGSLAPLAANLPETLDEAMQVGEAVTFAESGAESELAVPIKVRGEVIGAFGFGGEALQNLSADDIALVEAVVDRVGLALENIRLVEQTSRRAEHEQIVNEITAKIVGSTDVNHILQTTVKELGRVLRAPQTSVQLRREKAE